MTLDAIRMFSLSFFESEAFIGLVFSANLMSSVLLVMIFCFSCSCSYSLRCIAGTRLILVRPLIRSLMS